MTCGGGALPAELRGVPVPVSPAPIFGRSDDSDEVRTARRGVVGADDVAAAATAAAPVVWTTAGRASTASDASVATAMLLTPRSLLPFAAFFFPDDDDTNPAFAACAKPTTRCAACASTRCAGAILPLTGDDTFLVLCTKSPLLDGEASMPTMREFVGDSECAPYVMCCMRGGMVTSFFFPSFPSLHSLSLFLSFSSHSTRFCFFSSSHFTASLQVPTTALRLDSFFPFSLSLATPSFVPLASPLSTPLTHSTTDGDS